MPGRFEGEEHPAARLTEWQVLRMRRVMRRARQRQGGRELVTMFAALYRVSHGTVSMAISGKTWRHLKGAVPPSRRFRRRAHA
ncbi:hypothetical protein J421_5574 (plasmid) [Gemmatirosa kalamazoonensis]|uniref:Uncharacterized protein n=1 Tax=Gemmatirosa kalamazoonensis TaxID=861299 RepID=W0RLX8_9BACT|nr:hypothetical protein [Gemmatirosa kalamazoonensis]AHG92089.1 hypothetical protein J421_4554 [Gemmatirosa kalamazoonensis]AHG92157.1 hypothetical protein J421_4622 [Gemmatirosa kalamazoonensis]AHG93109.1 hypothetical protein J421_5574 [Gemmatirosa kalamazoonensis]